MRKSSLLFASWVVVGCAGPTGIMADTDESSSSTGTDGTDATTNMTMTSSPTTTTASTTMTTDPTTTMTTNPTTTMDPDSSTTEDPTSGTTDGETGECVPGELNCPCDVGSTCSGDLVCVEGVCIDEPECDEPEGEPNDDEASAVELEEATCGADAMTAAGGFDGAETDWFVYHAVDAIACFQGPNIEVTADIDVAVCAFLSCDSGNEDVSCIGAEDDTSPDGLPGCCDQNSVAFDFNCQLGGSNGNIFVRLVSVEAACTPYEMAFDY